jgi:hypothetical protein
MSTSRPGLSRSFPATHRGLLAALVVSTSVLSACYIVPIDPRTGQPYPTVVSRDPSVPAGGSAVLAAAPAQPTTLTVRLYPVNEQANAGGMLSATVVDNNAGHGSFSVTYRGDILVGESTRVDAGYVGFGRIHDEVLGRPIGSVQRSYSGRRGVANAYGAKGVNAQCEYLISGPGMGTGACLFSDGAKYQMHFAG